VLRLGRAGCSVLSVQNQDIADSEEPAGECDTTHRIGAELSGATPDAPMGYLEWRTCDHGAATICADEWMTMQSATPSRATDTPTIVTIGDSHSKFFGPPKYFAGRAGLRTPLRYTIEPNPISAASVAGFRPGVSTLDVKTKVHQALTGASMAILSFGQVDLELGLYYRRAVKGEEWEAEQYAAWLAE